MADTALNDAMRTTDAADLPPAHTKVTREDWLQAAMRVLIEDGVERVKVQTLGVRLNVSRSSFYWYFKSRQDLLDALLEHWQNTNTAALLAQAAAPAGTITGAVCNVFRCVINPALFDNALDFAIRDWARRAPDVRAVLDRSDTQRLAGLSEMFRRYGYDETEAVTRARVLYYMQLGYDIAQLNEPLSQRLTMVPHYLFVFTGRTAAPAELAEFNAYARRVAAATQPEGADP